MRITYNSKFPKGDQLLNLTDRVVKCYTHIIPKEEREDIKMDIIEKYLNKEEKICNNFKGDSQITTYVLAILNRICCSAIRKESKRWDLIYCTDFCPTNINTTRSETEDSVLIKDEINYLQRILLLLNDNSKTVTFLAFYYNLEAKTIFTSKYLKKLQKSKLVKLLNPKEDRSKADRFIILAQITNKVEGKNIQADAVRIWLNKEITKIVNRLNGSTKRANYNKDSFQVLFEKYYSSIDN